jgi:hypothetical protein
MTAAKKSSERVASSTSASQPASQARKMEKIIAVAKELNSFIDKTYFVLPAGLRAFLHFNT